MKRKLFFIIFSLLLLLPFTSVDAASKVTVHVFYGEGCGYCHNLLNYLDRLKLDPEYKDMFDVQKYETWSNSGNKALGERVATELNTRFSGVPWLAHRSWRHSGGEEDKALERKPQSRQNANLHGTKSLLGM